MFDRVAENIVCDKVIVDDFESSYDATQHLIKLGSKRIALLSTISNLSVGQLRFNGYQKALEENNIIKNDNLLIIENEIELFDKKLASLLQNEKVDAVFALDEHASTMAMKIAIKNGIKMLANTYTVRARGEKNLEKALLQFDKIKETWC